MKPRWGGGERNGGKRGGYQAAQLTLSSAARSTTFLLIMGSLEARFHFWIPISHFPLRVFFFSCHTHTDTLSLLLSLFPPAQPRHSIVMAPRKSGTSRRVVSSAGPAIKKRERERGYPVGPLPLTGIGNLGEFVSARPDLPRLRLTPPRKAGAGVVKRDQLRSSPTCENKVGRERKHVIAGTKHMLNLLNRSTARPLAVSSRTCHHRTEAAC